MNFRALSFKKESLGKLIKTSKMGYIWEFELSEKFSCLSLTASKFTGNYEVKLNKDILYKGNYAYDRAFQFSFKVEGVPFSIVEFGTSYQLIIQSKSFEHYKNSEGRKTLALTPNLIPQGRKNSVMSTNFSEDTWGKNQNPVDNLTPRKSVNESTAVKINDSSETRTRSATGPVPVKRDVSPRITKVELSEEALAAERRRKTFVEFDKDSDEEDLLVSKFVSMRFMGFEFKNEMPSSESDQNKKLIDNLQKGEIHFVNELSLTKRLPIDFANHSDFLQEIIDVVHSG